jgi:hypothetical protein
MMGIHLVRRIEPDIHHRHAAHSRIRLGAVSSSNMTVIMNSVPPEARSIASALGATARSLGMLSGMLAIALFISLELGNAPVDQHPVELIAIMTGRSSSSPS